MNGSTSRLYWIRGLRNFGDRMAPLVFQHLTGRLPEYCTPDCGQSHFLSIGSMLADASAHSTVWGTGILKWNNHLNPQATISMVRGPLSYAAVRSQGIRCPPLWGDPVSFAREMFPQASTLLGEWCIVPHIRDRLVAVPEGLSVVHPSLLPHEFCAQLTGYRYVLSSSLHGLVAAHSFGIKAGWLKLSNRPLGDDTKFRDYCLAAGISPEPIVVDDLELRTIAKCESRLAVGESDLDAMRAVCPFN